jgi:prolyl-tRNA editing enzyme YbaK/EbsC (Cys-tRNA(Pro) deacylase)
VETYLRGPIDLSRELLEADVLHEIVHLRRRIDDAVELPDVLDVPPEECFAVRLYDSDAGLLAALVPAESLPATTALANAVRCRIVRPIDPGRVSAVTDYHPLLVSPIGLPRDVRTVADATLALQDVVYTPTGDGSTALKIRAHDLLDLTGADVADLVEPGAAVTVVPRR